MINHLFYEFSDLILIEELLVASEDDVEVEAELRRALKEQDNCVSEVLNGYSPDELELCNCRVQREFDASRRYEVDGQRCRQRNAAVALTIDRYHRLEGRLEFESLQKLKITLLHRREDKFVRAEVPLEGDIDILHRNELNRRLLRPEFEILDIKSRTEAVLRVQEIENSRLNKLLHSLLNRRRLKRLQVELDVHLGVV